jgi:CRISPR-associated endonuclease/helicase Cas3
MESVKIHLDPHYELLADPSEVPEIVQQVIGQPLAHQLRTYQLQKTYDLVLNTFPTGTGKTKAALLHLLDQRQANTLFIAPTNELIDQHCQDINEFKEKAGLRHLVCPANAKLLREIDPANELYRQGERFYRLMKNPMEFAEQLGIPPEKRTSRCPVILVTNPDLFYYTLYSCYANLDRRNLFEAMFTFFEYIVIDEFHYYNAKQLANFLFFLALSLEFGYFEFENRKVCLLSATPDPQVYKYLERLALQGLKWKSVEPEHVESENPLAVRTLAPVNLTFLGFDDLSDYSKAYASQIKTKLTNSLDGALITNSLIDVNRTVANLKAAGLNSDRDFGRITGAVSRRERKIAAKKPLIVATPTVDIGYNFVKYAKARQNLDFVVFTARYSDEFWQRLGRTGRVLGKSEQGFASDAVALISAEALGKIRKSIGGSSNFLTREQLKQLLVNTKVFSRKPFLHEYISSYSILEAFRPLYELRKQMRSEDRVKDVFERVREIFAPTSKKGYKHYVAALSRFYALQAAVREEYSDRLIREFLNTANFWHTGTEDYSAKESTLAQFQRQLKVKDLKYLEVISKYVSEEYYALASIFSFRDSFQSLSCAVYDPYNIISDHEVIVYYELFHLLRYYDLHWYKTLETFQASFSEASHIQQADLYCQVNRAKDKEENLTISFSLTTSEPDLDSFKHRYCGKPIAIRGLKLQATQGKDNRFVPLSPQLTDAIRDRYITCLLVPEQGGEPGEIKGRTRDIQISLPSILVNFPNSKEIKFRAIFGTNVYLIGARIQKYLYTLERKNEYWIC